MSNKELYPDSEQARLDYNREHAIATEKWGPYVSDRQWGTVREDYSADGNAWDYFPHDHARSRTYRWGEDGLAGISDDQQFLCFAPAFWNGKDAILKERLFGLNNHEGNHGEDVKELYYYLENTPTHSYMKFLYKYPQAAFPYDDLINSNKERGKLLPEYELLDTGVFSDNRYFDIYVEYAKNGTEDILIRIRIVNRGKDAASITILPTLWFRNQWSFYITKYKPEISLSSPETGFGKAGCATADANHHAFGNYRFYFPETALKAFTENETNQQRLFGIANPHPYVKDFFHSAVVNNNFSLLRDKREGTKFSPIYQTEIAGGATYELKLRLSSDTDIEDALGEGFDQIFGKRVAETDDFYANMVKPDEKPGYHQLCRLSMAGLLWTKQFYFYTIERWLSGDPKEPAPPLSHQEGRNSKWKTLNNRDILSMPDKWEYPWYASWDLAFHTLPIALIDPTFAKEQLIIITREWYMNPEGQIPAYEWNFSDTNPPLQAWAAYRIYQIENKQTGRNDVDFLKRIFMKLMMNFTWWVNKKDVQGLNVFEGGFLGLDNIGIFDRSQPIPEGGTLEQADGTAWMARYALNMLDIALEIAKFDPTYEDVASKFYEHFMYIAEAFNTAWSPEDHFFYDVLVRPNGEKIPIRIRSLVGVISTFAVSILDKDHIANLKSFSERMDWFSTHRKSTQQFLVQDPANDSGNFLLNLVGKDRLSEILRVVLDEEEFLSSYGLRSVSKYYEAHPYSLNLAGMNYAIDYEPAEASSSLFGGNSNWRGPIWMPLNFLFIEMLRKYYDYYGDSFKIECPTRSGNYMNLFEIAELISSRLVSIFLPDASGNRPSHGVYNSFYKQEGNQELVLFNEYFHGDTGFGLGASHQTGWTSLVAGLIEVFELKRSVWYGPEKNKA